MNNNRGYFTIQQRKIEQFKSKIRKITDLRFKNKVNQVINKLNNKILGFGHYYKHTSCKGDFQKLDSFIRKRLRRYIIRSKSYKKLPNLILTNSQLKELGLKSLSKIKSNLENNNSKLRKNNKNKRKSSNNKKQKLINPYLKLKEKLIFNKLDNLITLMKKLNKKGRRIGRKFNQRKR